MQTRISTLSPPSLGWMLARDFTHCIDNRKYFSYNGIALDGQERGLILYEEAFDPALFPTRSPMSQPMLKGHLAEPDR